MEVCVSVWKASVNSQKDRVQRTFWLVNIQRFGEYDVPGEGKEAPHTSCIPFSVDLFLLGIPELCACVRAQSCPTLCNPLKTVAHQAPLSMEFSRQEYCSGFSCPPSGDLPDPGMEPASLASPLLTGGFFTTALPGKVLSYILL